MKTGQVEKGHEKGQLVWTRDSEPDELNDFILQCGFNPESTILVSANALALGNLVKGWNMMLERALEDIAIIDAAARLSELLKGSDLLEEELAEEEPAEG